MYYRRSPAADRPSLAAGFALRAALMYVLDPQLGRRRRAVLRDRERTRSESAVMPSVPQPATCSRVMPRSRRAAPPPPRLSSRSRDPDSRPSTARCRPTGMHALWLVLLLVPLGDVGLQTTGDAEQVARELVPVLRDLRREIVVEQGTLPPSPFTGRNSTLIAIRVGVRSLAAPPEALRLIDRLIARPKQEPLNASERAVVAKWVETLRAAVQRRLALAGKDPTCSDACVVQHLIGPSDLFGTTRRQQRGLRNDIILDTLIESLDDGSFR
jgi:hypothetical protein